MRKPFSLITLLNVCIQSFYWCTRMRLFKEFLPNKKALSEIEPLPLVPVIVTAINSSPAITFPDAVSSDDPFISNGLFTKITFINAFVCQLSDRENNRLCKIDNKGTW